MFSRQLLEKGPASMELLFLEDRQGANLLDDLIKSSAPAAGRDDLLGAGSLSEIQVRSHGAHRIAWESFKHYAKHYGRYFDHPGTHPRETILKPIAHYFPQIRIVLPARTAIWRARVMKNGDRPYMCGVVGASPHRTMQFELRSRRTGRERRRNWARRRPGDPRIAG